MTWQEFRRWAWDAYGYRIQGGHSVNDSAWRPIHGLRQGRWSGPYNYAVAGSGSGRNAAYDLSHQRRLAVWLRSKGLLANEVVYDWLDEAEKFESGWLVNDGRGIRWIADPEFEALDLARRGFVAIRCGL